jgi:DMSO/TMAO reductase YedYZ molybdopterin-dependent catalytic subunit
VLYQFLIAVKETLKQNKILVIVLFLILLVAGFFAVQVWMGLNSVPVNYPEIREYNGIQLSSINDFQTEAIVGVQNINISTYTLVVTGLVQNTTTYTYDEVINNHGHYLKVVVLHCVEGWQVTALWEGVQLKDLLADAGYNLVAGYHESAEAVIFYAQDGYTTSLPLSYVLDKNLLIAYKVNNVTLPAKEGYPFRLVAEDKLGYKWIKWVTKISVSNDTSYLGYWESNGYSNDASVP